MSRNFQDWLSAYVTYASFSEAPTRMHFFSGVSAIAGALRRKVWFEQNYYRYHCNHYIILVAPPGIVSKSTTAGLAMNLLRKVPGVNFGPDVVTWQALVTAFAEKSESFPLPCINPDGSQGQEFHAQCALTVMSSELGNLLDPQDRQMVDLLVNLWDSNPGAFKKSTKGSGNDSIENPWINIIGCTTPSWIASAFPEYVIGGGFTSRTLFVYAEEKKRLIAYPADHMPEGMDKVKELLIQDLEWISMNLAGGFKMTPEAKEWGTAWYENLHTNPPKLFQDDRFAPYLARKQVHLHKLAMILSAAKRDDLTIELADLTTAEDMLLSIEEDMPKVFSKIGQTEKGLQAGRFISYIKSCGKVNQKEAYRYIHAHFPDAREFSAILAGAINSGQVQVFPEDGELYLVFRQ